MRAITECAPPLNVRLDSEGATGQRNADYRKLGGAMSVVARVSRRSIEHPLPLAAVLVLVVNDHVLKGAGLVPSWLTGKLSDVAGLFFFPVLLVSLARGVRLRLSPSRAAAVTAVAFAAVKLVPLVNHLVARAWGPMVMDRTDLLALPMAALAARWMATHASDSEATRATRATRDWGRFAALVAASLATVATPAIHVPPCRERPLPPVHVSWDQTCMHAPQLSLQLSPGLARLRMPLRPKSKGCPSPIVALSLEWQATPDVRAVATVPQRLLPRPSPIEQEVVLEAAIDLPYAARCASIEANVITWSSNPNQEVVIDTPITTCTEGP
jgi:hypothetical protein